MAKNPKTIEGILADSSAWGECQRAEERHLELQRERGALDEEITRARDAAPEGVRVEGGQVVEHFGQRRTPLSTWIQRRNEREEAEALVEGREPVALADPTIALAELHERRDRIVAAIEVARERVGEARRAARAELRPALQTAYADLVARPLIPLLEAFGELADAGEAFVDELRRDDLDGITGLDLGSYSGRRESSRLNILLRRAGELTENG